MAKTYLPMALPGGDLLPHMSAKRRHQVCDVVFEMLGGTDRLHHEAGRDRESYWEFMKLWSKGLPRAVATEHTISDDADALLAKLDAAVSAKTIDGIYEVCDAPEK